MKFKRSLIIVSDEKPLLFWFIRTFVKCHNTGAFSAPSRYPTQWVFEKTGRRFGLGGERCMDVWLPGLSQPVLERTNGYGY